MNVVFSLMAENDLESIGDAIAINNPQRAVTFIREIRDRCLALSNTPKSRAKTQRHCKRHSHVSAWKLSDVLSYF